MGKIVDFGPRLPTLNDPGHPTKETHSKFLFLRFYIFSHDLYFMTIGEGRKIDIPAN